MVKTPYEGPRFTPADYRAKCRELKAEVELWQQQSNAHYLRVCHLEKREADLEAEVERLKAALNNEEDE